MDEPKILPDCSIEVLSEHLDKWWNDRVSSSAGGNLNDHNYLLGVIRDNTQDITELFNITRGILNRLKEATDVQPSDKVRANDTPPRELAQGVEGSNK